MKIKITYKENSVEKIKHKYIQDFIKFLFENYPLKKNLEIIFLSKRIGKMTTGCRSQKNELKILGKGRMIRDILRTLAHEWIHEYQIDIMGRKIGPNIGGINEDEANSIAGKLLKIFEKKYPEKEYMMYE